MPSALTVTRRKKRSNRSNRSKSRKNANNGPFSNGPARYTNFAGNGARSNQVGTVFQLLRRPGPTTPEAEVVVLETQPEGGKAPEVVVVEIQPENGGLRRRHGNRGNRGNVPLFVLSEGVSEEDEEDEEDEGHEDREDLALLLVLGAGLLGGVGLSYWLAPTV